LFLERCLDLAREGGLVAIIIDDGVLNAPSNEDTREHILRRAHPIAVVSLPDSAFMPYASVKASILFLRKRHATSVSSEPEATFFGQAENVGRKPNGDPLFKIDPGTRRLVLDSDLPEILRLWRRGHPSTPTAATDDARGYWTHIPTLVDSQFRADGLRLDLAYHHPARLEAARALQSSAYPLVPLAHLCEARNEMVVPSQELQDEEITYIGLANIESGTGTCLPSIVESSQLKSAAKRALPGDILFAKMRPELRKVCLLADDVGEAFTSAECIVLTPRTSADGEPMILPELLATLLRLDLAYGQVVHLVIGIGRPRLSKSAVMGIKVPLPPIPEQRHLLEMYKRAEAAAGALVEASERAKKESNQILTDAGRDLVDSVLTGRRESR
jgi:hypothetical protein